MQWSKIDAAAPFPFHAPCEPPGKFLRLILKRKSFQIKTEVLVSQPDGRDDPPSPISTNNVETLAPGKVGRAILHGIRYVPETFPALAAVGQPVNRKNPEMILG
jgi:hypothetical protein